MAKTIEFEKPYVEWGGKRLIRKDVVQMPDASFLKKTDDCKGWCVVNRKEWFVLVRDRSLIRYPRQTAVSRIPYGDYTKLAFLSTYGLTTDDHQDHYHKYYETLKKATQFWL